MEFDFSMLSDEDFARAQQAVWDEAFRRMGLEADAPGKHEAPEAGDE